MGKSRQNKRHRPNGRCLQQIISTLCTGEGRFAAAVLYGYSFETTNELANELLNRGGMDHTMWTINLILLAVAYGGALERCGCVEALFGKLKHHLHSVGSLILASLSKICSLVSTMFGFLINRHSNLYSAAVKSNSFPFLNACPCNKSTFIPLDSSCVSAELKSFARRSSAFTLDTNTPSLNGFVI